MYRKDTEVLHRQLLVPFMKSGSSSVGRATAFQAVGREFDPRLPLFLGRCSSVVEYFLGKEGVTGSNPVIGSVNGWLR